MLILASQSSVRRKILAEAGIPFTAQSPAMDENAAKKSFPTTEAGPLAEALAAAKALSVSGLQPEAHVIGADQTLSCEGEIFHKPSSIDGARRQLIGLRGRTHVLHSALSCARNGKIIWAFRDDAALTMRLFSEVFLDNYLAVSGPAAMTSVGCYQLEGQGVQLFDRIEGDYFTVLGLPLLPLLKFLREIGKLPS